VRARCWCASHLPIRINSSGRRSKAGFRSEMRLLCLHGHRTSGSILREQMVEASAALEAALGPALDLRFPNAPHPARGPAQQVVQATWPNTPYFEWWDKGEDGSYSGADETLEFIRDYEQMHGPFDGVVGFSQGGALAALLCSQVGSPAAVLPSLRLGLIMSGFVPADPVLKARVQAAAPIRVPTLLVYSSAWDFERQGAEQLGRLWATGAVTTSEHGGGHAVPRSKYAGGAAALEAMRLLAARASSFDGSS
jgi:predicted esterase